MAWRLSHSSVILLYVSGLAVTTMIFIPALLNIRSVFTMWRRGKESPSGLKGPSDNVPSISKETITVQSFQPEAWDEEKFFKELGDFLEQDVRRKVSVEVSENPLFLEMFRESFNLHDSNNQIRKACLRDIKNKGITFEELYYQIIMGLAFD